MRIVMWFVYYIGLRPRVESEEWRVELWYKSFGFVLIYI